MLIVWLLNAQPALSLPQSTVPYMPKDAWLLTKGYSLYLKTWLFEHLRPFAAATTPTPDPCMKIGRMLISTYPLHYTLAPSLAPPSASHYGMWAEVWVLSKCSPKPSVHTLPSFNKQMRADRVSMCVCLCECASLLTWIRGTDEFIVDNNKGFVRPF